jgi:hypothetical protein
MFGKTAHMLFIQTIPMIRLPLTLFWILDGEMTVTSEGTTETYKAGERFDVPAGTVHSAKIGSNGCRYIIGEK